MIVTAIFASTIFATSISAVFAQGRSGNETVHKQYLWLIEGNRVFFECDIPETEQGSTKATCHDHEIIDLHNNRVIGRATDATADINADFEGDGMVATGTTFFKLRQGNFTVRGRGTIQPILEGNPTLNDAPVTNIAGIFPEPGENQVIEGTGIFEGAEGTFTLLGALDTTNFAGDVPGSQFFCVFVIDLQLQRSAIRNIRNRGDNMGIFADLLDD